jgi:hypothetical protein
MRWEPLDGVAMPNPDDVLWRYMGFDRYAWLVATSSLWFARADKLGDHFEGSRTSQDPHPDQQPHAEHLAAIAHASIHLSFVSCWSLSSVESMGLWTTFAGNASGVAITTTVGRLSTALEPTSDPFNAGLVRYIDYQTDAIDPQVGDFRRRLFSQAPELRARARVPRGHAASLAVHQGG